MTITIPDQTLEDAKISAADLLVDVAVYLYDKERLSIGQARKLAGMDLLSFQKALADRNVYLKYSADDLDADVRNMKLG